MSASSSSARAPAWEWAQSALLAANLVWTTLCLGGYRPDTMVVTSGLNGLLLLIHFAARLAGASGRSHPAGKYLLPFLAYALANVLWVTPVRWLGWRDWLEWAQMTAVFWVVLNGVRSPGPRTMLLMVLMGLGAIAVGLECYQRFFRPDWLMLGRTQAAQFIGRSSGPFGMPNSLAAFLLLLLPAAFVLAWRRGGSAGMRLIFAAVTPILLLGLVLTISRGAWLGFVLAITAWPLFASRHRWFWRLGAALAVLGLTLSAGAVLYFSMPAVRDRLDRLVHDAGEKTRPIMWRGAWEIFKAQPVFGGGAAAFNILFERYRPEPFQDNPQWAHNDYLNTLCDYGAAGFVLFFGAAGLIAWRSRRRTTPEVDRPARAVDDPLVMQALGVGVLAFALQLFVDFHFKIPALAMSLATVAALIVQNGWPAAPGPAANSSSLRLADAGALAGVAAISIVFVYPCYRSEAIRYSIRYEIDDLARNPAKPEAERAVIARAMDGLKVATQLDPGNAQAWADRAYVTALWSHHEPSRTAALGHEAEDYARRALARSQVVAEFWLRLGVALDMEGRWLDAGDAFAEAQNLAPSAATPWYYEAFHLALRPSGHALAESAVAICLRLDPGNREAEALRQRLAGIR